MIKRIAALTFIFVCTSIAWIILGETIVARTDSPMSSELKSRVAASWGTAQQQSAPTASYNHKVVTKVETDKGTKEVETTETVPLSVDASKIDVALNLKHRQKGLLWYSTYAVTFGGDYTFTNSSDQDRDVVFRLPFPASQAIYDDLVMSVDDQPLLVNNTSAGATGSAHIAAGKAVVLHTGYRSQGVDSWQYNFGEGISQIRNFTLHMRTNFKDIDFPENTMSPTTKSETGGGWDLVWSYKNLVAGYEIGMTMPEKLQPGPLAGQISYFAPISLFFFFFLMFIISTLRGIDLHPMNYFFFAAAFFSFHLLLAYLVDHISIHLAFLICSLVSTFLVVTLRAARRRDALRRARSGAGTIHLPGLVFVCLFLQGLHWAGNHNRFDPYAVRGHADDRANPAGG